MSDRLDIPEFETPHESPQQKQLKQLKVADLEARATTPAPTGDEPSLHPKCPNAGAGSPMLGISANKSKNGGRQWSSEITLTLSQRAS